jgi:hypothetical protein
LEKCLRLQWGRRLRALLLAGLVRALVRQAGGTSLQMQEVAAVPLVQELLGLGEERDLGQLLREAAGLRVVGDGCSVEVQGGTEAASGRSDDWGAIGAGRGLRAMRWRLHTLMGHEDSRERMLDEISKAYVEEGDAGGKWDVGVALSAAYQSAGYTKARFEQQEVQMARAKDLYERALRMRLDTLGEHHPATASTLLSVWNFNTHNVVMFDRALRIFKATLGQHPATACAMMAIGNQYDGKNTIKLFEQALGIYERTVGRMHRFTASAIKCMCEKYYIFGDFVKAEVLGMEALHIFTKTLGHDHKETNEARDILSKIRKARGR